MWRGAVVAMFGAFALSLILGLLVRRIALRFGFVDQPIGRKRHDRPTPLGGGVAITLAIIVPTLVGAVVVGWLEGSGLHEWIPMVWRPHVAGVQDKFPLLIWLGGIALALHLLGLIDDLHPLGPWLKFAVQMAAAWVVAGPLGVRVVEVLPAPCSILLTVLWIVIITNSFNFLDNTDGLSAGVAVIASLLLAITAFRAGQLFVPMLACVIAGSALGFLVLNFAPARLFMGDAGSLPLGFFISVVTILTTYYDSGQDLTPLGIVVPVVILAVPLYDVISVVILRLRTGDHPFRGDRRHFAHRLVRRGMQPRAAVLTIYLATAATGLPAIILPTADWGAALLLLLQCVCVVIMIAVLEHTGSPSPST